MFYIPFCCALKYKKIAQNVKKTQQLKIQKRFTNILISSKNIRNFASKYAFAYVNQNQGGAQREKIYTTFIKKVLITA